jgi:WD40 repeat protein
MTPDARELIIGRDGSTVSVYVRAGVTFLPNTTINLPDSSIKRVKMSDNHQCLAVGSEYNYAAIYSRSGQDLLLTQNITNIPAYSLDLSSDCKDLLIGSIGSALYFESEGSSVFKQVQYLDAQYQFVMRSKMSKDQQLILLGNTSGRMYVYSRDPQLTS